MSEGSFTDAMLLLFSESMLGVAAVAVGGCCWNEDRVWHWIELSGIESGDCHNALPKTKPLAVIK